MVIAGDVESAERSSAIAPVDPLVRRPLYQQVQERVLDLIHNGVLAVGDQLPSERTLSASLGVSRHSLRMALSALEAQGMVEIRHGSGAYLVATEPAHAAEGIAEALVASGEDLPHIMEARLAVEPFLAGLAAERRTPEDLARITQAFADMRAEIARGESGEHGDVAFHDALNQAAHSPVLLQFIVSLQPRLRRLREEALAQLSGPHRAVEGHRAILDAIRDGDRDAASQAATRHLVEAAQSLLVSEFVKWPDEELRGMLMQAARVGGVQPGDEPGGELGRRTLEGGIEPTPGVLSLRPYQAGQSTRAVKEELGLTEVHKLASNENPRGCSPAVGPAVATALAQIATYPDMGGTDLRDALALHHGLPTEQVILGNGSDEVLLMVARALLAPGRIALAPEPTFQQYRNHTLSTGAEYVPLPGGPGDDGVIASLTSAAERASVIWLSNPNNPTGTYVSTDGLEELLRSIPTSTVVVLDEAYADYVTAPDYPDSVSLLGRHPNLVVTRTFSKIYGLAGMRIGYGLARPELTKLLEALRSPFNTSSIAQAGALAALGDRDFWQRSRDENTQLRNEFEDLCRRRGWAYVPSQANFVLFRPDFDELEAFSQLRAAGFVVRPGTPIGVPGHLRVSIGTDIQMGGFAAALADLS